MEMFNLWLPIIGGGFLFAIAVSAWFSDYKSTGIWFGFFGLVCFLLLAALQLQEHITSAQADAKSGPTEAEKRQLRAYITLTKIVPHPTVPAVGQPYRIQVEFKNTGKSPAREVSGYCVNEGIKRGERPTFDYSKLEPSTMGQMAADVPHFIELLPIGSTAEHGSRDWPMDSNIMNILGSGETRLYVHGRWDYRDDFGRPHWMTFCYYLTVPIDGHFSVCTYHNETDNN
jgi:hypothetical protein